MNDSVLRLVHFVALRLGELRDDVVFVGGAIRGLLVTDPAVEGPRPTDDVDVIVEVVGRLGYYALTEKLRRRRFTEDSSEGAPICRFRAEGVKLDVMPTDEAILGFSNRWYPHAMATAEVRRLELADLESVPIRVISAPSFLATKLVAFQQRGGGQMEHRDVEDIVALVDGRDALLGEVEREVEPLRQFIGEAIDVLMSQDLADKLRWHLAPDAASQARHSMVLTRLRRLARVPRICMLAQRVCSPARGGPGGTGEASEGPWTYELSGVEPEVKVAPVKARGAFVAVSARLIDHGRTGGSAGDGSDVVIEDGQGRRVLPSAEATSRLRRQRGLLQPGEAIRPDEPFETVWVYDVPRGARELRLLLPFDRCEVRLGR